jgi:hypothetical protein
MSEPERAFLVTETVAAPSDAELSTLDRAMELACARLDAGGRPTRLVGASYLPAQQRWLGLVVTDSHETAWRAAAIAQLATCRVVEV